MTKTGAWLAKALLTGAAAGVATFAISYGFLIIHQELGIRPAISYGAALLAFVCGTVVGLIYFRMKKET
jgi:hypothetical protein